MDFARAVEIVNSPKHIQVLYEDKSVWIENLDQNTNTAEIRTGPQFNKRMTVSVKDLEEAHNKH